jgi:dihydroorotase
MEELDLVLNLHGESPSTPGSDVTVLNAEERFLPTLFKLHEVSIKFSILDKDLVPYNSVSVLNSAHVLLRILDVY